MSFNPFGGNTADQEAIELSELFGIPEVSIKNAIREGRIDIDKRGKVFTELNLAYAVLEGQLQQSGPAGQITVEMMQETSLFHFQTLLEAIGPMSTLDDEEKTRLREALAAKAQFLARQWKDNADFVEKLHPEIIW